MTSSNSELNYKLTVAYDGSDFHGLAPNPGVRTVVGEIEKVINGWLGIKPAIVMSGRTDAGVHSAGQVLNFKASVPDDSPERLQNYLNSRLAPEVVVNHCEVASESFSARFDATARHYQYSVLNTAFPSPFKSLSHWHISEPLDVEKMNAAASYFLGTHDFSAFCRRPKTPDGSEPASLIRRIDSALWLVLDDGELRFDISGSAFCHQMVRSITGFLVSIGRGKRSVEETPKVIESLDRANAEQLAPPHGLCLYKVSYDS